VTAAPTSSAGVRHDLRHGLSGLQALLESVRHEPADVSAVLAAASVELRYVMGLVDGLSSSAVDAAAVPPSARGTCDLADVVRTAARAAAWSDRRIDLDCPDSAPVALGASAATRVVRNLLGNALAAPGGTAVLVQVRPVPGAGAGDATGALRLEVHDDGSGPDDGDFSRPGGIGLDVVRSLVLGAGGWLCLGRSASGGVRAAVTLPAPSEVLR
jgi:signal transduction histidine kinase